MYCDIVPVAVRHSPLHYYSTPPTPPLHFLFACPRVDITPLPPPPPLSAILPDSSPFPSAVVSSVLSAVLAGSVHSYDAVSLTYKNPSFSAIRRLALLSVSQDQLALTPALALFLHVVSILRVAVLARLREDPGNEDDRDRSGATGGGTRSILSTRAAHNDARPRPRYAG